MGVWEISEKNSCTAKTVRKKIVRNCGEINLASAFTAFNHPGPVIDFKKSYRTSYCPPKKVTHNLKVRKKFMSHKIAHPFDMIPLKT